MRIGVFDPYLDTLGGGEKYMLTIASCLSEDHKVEVLWDESDILDKASSRFGLDLSHVKVSQNIFSPRFNFLKRMLSTRSFDAIFYLSDGSIPTSLARKTIIHFQFPVEWTKTKTLKTKLKFLKVNSVIVNSRFTKSYIDKKFGIKSHVVYPPVTIPKANHNHNQKENIILHVGRFTGISFEGPNYKKQDVMVNVFKQMIDQGLTKWKLILVVSVMDRDRDRFEEFKKKAKRYPIEFVVNGNNSILWEYYRRAKIYWHATGFGENINKHPELAEHFGISTVEAMSKGAVPVVINLGGQKEIVTDGNDGFLWDTLSQLEEKTSQLIQNPKLLAKLSESSKEKIFKFAGDRFCNDIKKLI